MHALNPSRSVARSVALFVPAVALLVSGCNRDELAPDCFAYDINGNCIVPDPGGVAAGINCAEFPVGAVGADYSFTPEVGGGSGNFDSWMATNLPPGLSIDPDTGEISGVPEEPMEYSGITLSVFDVGKSSTETADDCGPLLINPALSSTPVSSLDRHCVPFDTPKAEWVSMLTGGDETDVVCRALTDNGGTCPLGDGNGRLPPSGIMFDADTCTHSGSIDVDNDRAGTYVWVVEIEQNGFVTGVPFCAVNDIDTYHDIVVVGEGQDVGILQPGFLEHAVDEDLSFGGNGSWVWTIDDPACPGPDCNNFGFRFDVTCSPFNPGDPYDPNSPDPLSGITLSPSAGTETGMMHELFGKGPAVDPKFENGRPWVASFEMSYCTSDDGSLCDVNNMGAFETNAQTKYHFDVVGFPQP